MLFYGSSISSLAIICAALLVLVSQGQVAVALPLGPEPTAAAVTVVTTPQHINQDIRPWYIRRRFRSPEIRPCDDTREDCDNISTIPPLVVSPTVTPRTTKNIARQLIKRAPTFSENVLTYLVVALIVGSVLLGAGIASIAVFGFDWKNALRKSDKRDG
jgi:hypothetical protein